MMAIDEITKRRAYTVFELTKERLLDGDEDESISETYKFSYLLLRGPRVFLDTFGAGDLYLQFDKINDGYYQLRFDLFGPKGLTAEEENVIYQHNDEVRDLLNHSTGTLYS